MALPDNSVSVSTSSSLVYGNATTFLAAENDLFCAGGQTVPIASVQSPTQLTLKQPWPIASLTGAPYNILSLGEHWRQAITINKRLADLLSKWEVVSPFKFDAAGTLAERDTYNNQPRGFVYVALDPLPVRIFIKRANTNSSADWSDGIYIGSGGQAEFQAALDQERQQRVQADAALGQRSTNAEVRATALEFLTGLFARVGGRLGLNTANPQTDYDVRGRLSVGVVAPHPSDLAGNPVHTVIQDPASIAAIRYVRSNVASADTRMFGTVGSQSDPPRLDFTHADLNTALMTLLLDGSRRVGFGRIPKSDFDLAGRALMSLAQPFAGDLAGNPVLTLIQDALSGSGLRLVKQNHGKFDAKLVGTLGSNSDPLRLDLTDTDNNLAILTLVLGGSGRIGKGIIPRTDLHVLGRGTISDTPSLVDADIVGGTPLFTLATSGASGSLLRLVKADVGSADLIISGTATDRSLNRLDFYDRANNAYPMTVMLNGSRRVGIGQIVPLDTLHVEGTFRLSDAAKGGSTQFLYPTAADGSLLSGRRSLELTLRNNISALNVIALQNMNPAGFSAAVFRDQYDVEHGAVGWGNDGTGSPFVGTAYFEASVYTGTAHTTPPPPFIIVTTGFMKAPDAPGAYGTYERLQVRPDGFFSLKNLRFGSNDFNYDQYNARLGLRVRAPIVDLQVNGIACFADREVFYAPDATEGSRLVLLSGNGQMVRFVKPDVGKVDWQFNGSAGAADRRMSVIDGSIEVLSVMANGTGSVGIKKAAPAAGVTLDVGGPIRAGTYTVGTVPAGVVGAQIYVSNARKVGEAAGSGTGVLAYYSNSAWRRPSDDTPIAA